MRASDQNKLDRGNAREVTHRRLPLCLLCRVALRPPAKCPALRRRRRGRSERARQLHERRVPRIKCGRLVGRALRKARRTRAQVARRAAAAANLICAVLCCAPIGCSAHSSHMQTTRIQRTRLAQAKSGCYFSDATSESSRRRMCRRTLPNGSFAGLPQYNDIRRRATFSAPVLGLTQSATGAAIYERPRHFLSGARRSRV